MIAVTIFIVGSGSAIVAMMRALATIGAQRETRHALEAADSVLEVLRAEDFLQVYARYNADPNDDPAGAGTAPGPSFAVAGLDAAPADPDGMAGEIVFPGDGASLFEDGVDAALGMPRDLDLDGVIDNLDHADDHVVLPVLVRIRWSGASGARSIEAVSTLVPYTP